MAISAMFSEGEQAILQNADGALCLVDLIEVQREGTAPAYRPALVLFRYRVLTASQQAGSAGWPVVWSVRWHYAATGELCRLSVVRSTLRVASLRRSAGLMPVQKSSGFFEESGVFAQVTGVPKSLAAS